MVLVPHVGGLVVLVVDDCPVDKIVRSLELPTPGTADWI